MHVAVRYTACDWLLPQGITCLLDWLADWCPGRCSHPSAHTPLHRSQTCLRLPGLPPLQRLDAAVGKKFEALEEALEGKVGD